MSAIYLAARYSRQKEMLDVAHRLCEMGHAVTSRWVLGDHLCNDEILLDNPEVGRRFATEDIADIRRADTFVIFTDPIRTPTRGGKQVELGWAIAHGKRIIRVGPPENVFQTLISIDYVSNTDTLYTLLGNALERR